MHTLSVPTTTKPLTIALGATVSTFALFYLMQGLVKFDDTLRLDERPPVVFTDIVYNPPPVDPVRNKWIVDPPVITDPPIPDKFPPVPPAPCQDCVNVLTPPPPPTTLDHGPDFSSGFTEGEMIPLIRITPQYPRRELAAGVEGWAIVEFTVNADGMVENPFIVDSYPKNSFHRSTLNAIAKFKYKPKVVDGRAVPTKGVRYRMTYALENNG